MFTHCFNNDGCILFSPIALRKMTFKHNQIRSRIMLPLLFMIVCIFILLLWGSRYIEHTHLKNDARMKIDQTNRLFNDLLDAESKSLIAQLQLLAVNHDLAEAWQTGERQQLYDAAAPLFKKINKTSDITHFYFIAPDKSCFLRVHAPESNGDIINRYTLQMAAARNTTVHGIEMGPLGTFTLRVVTPWISKGKIQGYLELGKEIEHLVPQLKKITGLDLIFAVNKSLLSRQNWETGIKIFGKENNWDDFKNFVIIEGTLIHPPEGIMEMIKNSGSENHQPRPVNAGNRTLYASSIYLADAAKKNVGFILAFEDASAYLAASNSIKQTVLLVAIFIISLLIVFYFIYCGRLEHHILTYENQLEKLVKTRTSKLREARAEIRTLSGFLPICSSCKKIRDDNGYWNHLESYISAHSEALFSHGICEECAARLYPDIYSSIEKKDT